MALIRIWEILDYPCGQRLEPSLKETDIIEKLRTSLLLKKIPIKIHGELDNHNESEETNLKFSRSRPYKKNDNCYVEQKNWFSVRKRLGYLRFDTEKVYQ